MKYSQITLKERYTIDTLRKQGQSIAEIAAFLKRHRTTIWRELKRNRSPSHGAYEPDRADARCRVRRSQSRRNARITERDYAIVRRYLALDWSPEQISGTLKKLRILSISHETIYRYVWTDMAYGGSLWSHLRQSSKQRRKRYKAYDSRGRLANKRMIGERPAYIDLRKSIGHWEIDTVHGRGSNHCIVTIVERKSGYLIIGKLKNKSTLELNQRVTKLMDRFPGLFKTITADNGTEFHQYEKIENSTGTKFYFATPHHSWERGTNENTNGLIRQYLPKNSSMFYLTQQECNAIANKINDRPRKRLDFATPKEVFYGI